MPINVNNLPLHDSRCLLICVAILCHGINQNSILGNQPPFQTIDRAISQADNLTLIAAVWCDNVRDLVTMAKLASPCASQLLLNRGVAPTASRQQKAQQDKCKYGFHGVLNDAERPELRHAGPNDANREAELETPSRVACSDLLGLRFVIFNSIAEIVVMSNKNIVRVKI